MKPEDYLRLIALGETADLSARKGNTNMSLAPYAKAAVGFLVAFLTPLAAATLGDSLGGDKVVANEWLTALIAGLVTLVAVFTVPNKPGA